ncbi:MAG: glucose-6-phosphate dehydrogenase, partial [Bacteroidales bacterium]|nr:glucose-6-phosphate dehydrogenase [Bacteroidales bacterium]
MEKPGNLILVIFGATGDLNSRKLVPSLFSLMNQDLLPERFVLLGVGRGEMTSGDFRDKMAAAIRKYTEDRDQDMNHIPEFVKNLEYHRLDYNKVSDYADLGHKLMKVRNESGIGGNVIFYMATPPNIYETVCSNLSEAGLTDQAEGFRRIIIEKPFGYDLESAKRLNGVLHRLMHEDQIFRIDHYLGKETVQNLMVTRFANGIFEPLW